MSPDDRDDDRLPPEGDVSDDRFDAWVRAAARDYNRPAGATPTAAMWGAIDQALAAPPADALPGAMGSAAAPPAPARRAYTRLRTHWWQAAAAVALLAVGIGIGRGWDRGAGSGAPTVARAPEAPTAPASTAGDADAGPNVAARSASRPGSGARATGVDGAPERTDGSLASYDRAAVAHLSRAEALLTSFRAPAAGEGGTRTPEVGGTAGGMSAWARDLLADTRLLLDSPAATDARRRQLLQDLELVLAQIVQLPAEASADRGLVQRSIEQGAVLSRLRSSIPAGYASGT